MILLGLGSNLSSSFGDRFQNIDLAVSALERYELKLKRREIGIEKRQDFLENQVN